MVSPRRRASMEPERWRKRIPSSTSRRQAPVRSLSGTGRPRCGSTGFRTAVARTSTFLLFSRSATSACVQARSSRPACEEVTEITTQTVLRRNWLRLPATASPSPRRGAVMTYDSRAKKFILFGGAGASVVSDETWIWDGTTWTQLRPARSPAARINASFVYDSVHGKALLFGGTGADGRPRDDTWSWNGSVWTEEHSSMAPAARNGASMVNDEARGVVTLFGGQGLAGRTGESFNDLWTWDGSNWQEQRVAASPSARFGASMAYDPKSAKTVLFGGAGSGVALSDTWTWDGHTWRPEQPTLSPQPRVWSSMAYDSGTGRVVLFGGQDGATARNDTWTWDGATWTREQTTSAPPAGAYSAMAADSDLGLVLLFAASETRSGSGRSEIWLWSGAWAKSD